MILFDRYQTKTLQTPAFGTHMFSTTMIALVTCWLPLTAGCNSTVEEGVGEEKVVTSDAADAQRPNDSAGEDAQSSRYVSRESLPKHWLVPIGDTDQFFEPPTPTATPVAPTEAKLADAQVRLLGFATVGSGATAVQKAILKFSEKLVYMKVGDSHSGVALVSIEERSVNLQQGRERWTLALMDQPLTNAHVPYPTLQRGNSKRSRLPSSGISNPVEQSPFPDGLPRDHFPSGGGAAGNDASHQNLSAMQPPEIELPVIDLPEIDLPGLDLPQFPGQ